MDLKTWIDTYSEANDKMRQSQIAFLKFLLHVHRWTIASYQDIQNLLWRLTMKKYLDICAFKRKIKNGIDAYRPKTCRQQQTAFLSSETPVILL